MVHVCISSTLASAKVRTGIPTTTLSTAGGALIWAIWSPGLKPAPARLLVPESRHEIERRAREKHSKPHEEVSRHAHAMHDVPYEKPSRHAEKASILIERKEVVMKEQGYQSSFTAPVSPKEAMEKISCVPEWWEKILRGSHRNSMMCLRSDFPVVTATKRKWLRFSQSRKSPGSLSMPIKDG